jgi:hypothetical protein
MFSWLGRFAYVRRRLLLIAAALFVVLAGAWGSGVFGTMITGGLEPPGAESNRANELWSTTSDTSRVTWTRWRSTPTPPAS